jgi:hypothetical protein
MNPSVLGSDHLCSYVDSLHARIKLLETLHQNTHASADSSNHQQEPLAVLTPSTGVNTNDDHRRNHPRLNESASEVLRPSDYSSFFASSPAGVLPPLTHQSREPVQSTTAQKSPGQLSIFQDQTPKSSAFNDFGSRQVVLSDNINGTNEDTNSESEDEGIDAMGSASASLLHDATGNRQARTAYFGPSSTVTFMSYLQNAIGKSTGRSPRVRNLSEGQSDTTLNNDQSQRRRKGGIWQSTSEEETDMSPMEFCLPFRNQADSLLSSYWVSVWSLYPFLHKATFLARYAKIWESAEDQGPRPRSQDFGRRGYTATKSLDKLFYCTLNAVFALGCSFHPDLSARDRVAMSSVYFKRAKSLINFDLLENGSLQLVQTLLLMSQYLQSTEMVGSCWNLVGLAIRVAQGIGLHLSGFESSRNRNFTGGERPANQMQVEVARRVWGGCVFLDR